MNCQETRVSKFHSGNERDKGEEEKVVQQNESLCMNCQENISQQVRLLPQLHE